MAIYIYMVYMVTIYGNNLSYFTVKYAMIVSFPLNIHHIKIAFWSNGCPYDISMIFHFYPLILDDDRWIDVKNHWIQPRKKGVSVHASSTGGPILIFIPKKRLIFIDIQWFFPINHSNIEWYPMVYLLFPHIKRYFWSNACPYDIMISHILPSGFTVRPRTPTAAVGILRINLGGHESASGGEDKTWISFQGLLEHLSIGYMDWTMW